MSTPVSILIIGLDFSWTAAHRADIIDPTVLQNIIQQNIQALSNVPGLENETCFLDPEKKEEALDKIKDKLQMGHGGNRWSGVIIGWGVRAFADQTPLFESLVNLIRESSPESKLLFTNPTPSHLEAIQRNFPQLQESL